MNLFIKNHIHLSFNTPAEMTALYRSLQIDYPKFFKMDNLSKLGFLAAEKIFENEENRFVPREDIGIIGFNHNSSLEIDTQYQKTIQNNSDYFPSPSLFVYTLPNIVTGEIAIRNQFLGETSFFVTENFDVNQILSIVHNAFSDSVINEVLVAWIDTFNEVFEVKMFLITKTIQKLKFTIESLAFF